MNADLVNFYRGDAANVDGVMFEDVLAYSDAQMENTHTVIQWLFPSPDASAYSTTAPLMDADTAGAFRVSPKIQENLLRAFDFMLAFYGLKRDGREVDQADNFRAKAANWLTPNNHNHLRLTRIMQCMNLCGMREYAVSLYYCLLDIAQTTNNRITEQTLLYWKTALTYSTES